MVCVVTGSRGIGAAIGQLIPSVIVSRSPLNGLSLDLSRLDLIDGFCKELVAKHGPVDTLICAAGVSLDGLLLKQSLDNVQELMSINLMAPMLLAKGFLPGMIKARRGCIINITSVVGPCMANPGQSVYAASKSGLEGFTKSLALEVASKGIRCNTIAPGFTDTDMTRSLSPATLESHLKSIPLKKLASPQDIANACLFLMNSPYITGTTLVIDGGLSL